MKLTKMLSGEDTKVTLYFKNIKSIDANEGSIVSSKHIFKQTPSFLGDDRRRTHVAIRSCCRRHRPRCSDHSYDRSNRRFPLRFSLLLLLRRRMLRSGTSAEVASFSLKARPWTTCTVACPASMLSHP